MFPFSSLQKAKSFFVKGKDLIDSIAEETNVSVGPLGGEKYRGKNNSDASRDQKAALMLR